MENGLLTLYMDTNRHILRYLVCTPEGTSLTYQHVLLRKFPHHLSAQNKSIPFCTKLDVILNIIIYHIKMIFFHSLPGFSILSPLALGI